MSFLYIEKKLIKNILSDFFLCFKKQLYHRSYVNNMSHLSYMSYGSYMGYVNNMSYGK